MKTIYDVIIAGAGPAGSASAISLARRGHRVLLLDKEQFPRYKTCAGGVDMRAMAELDKLGVDISPAIQGRINQLEVTYLGRNPNHYRFPEPFVITTMRSELDMILAQTAAAAGTEFQDGEPLKSAADNGKTVEVTTSKARYEGRTLVGADGVYSRVARTFGLNKKAVTYVLNETEARPSGEVLDQWSSKVRVDAALWPLGYGWVFPKKDLLSIGTGVPLMTAKTLMPLVTKFRASLELGDLDVVKNHSHQIKFYRPGGRLARGRALVAGDAAGMVDPNNGAGIGWALSSGITAASVIDSYLQGGAADLEPYNGEISLGLGKESRLATVIRNTVVFRFMMFGARATAHRPLWEEVVNVIQGNEQYSDWHSQSKLASWLDWTIKIPI